MFEDIALFLNSYMTSYKAIAVICIAAVLITMLSHLIPTGLGAVFSVFCWVSCIVVVGVGVLNAGNLVARDLKAADMQIANDLSHSDLLQDLYAFSDNAESISNDYGVSFISLVNSSKATATANQEKAKQEIGKLSALLPAKR